MASGARNAFRPRLGNYRASGLTLLELVVVIAIIATLVSLLLPGVAAIRSTALRVRCTNQMKQIILAVHNSASVNQGRLPSVYPDSWNPQDSIFFLEIRGYIDRGELVQTGTDTDPWGGEISVYQCKLIRCPGDPTIAPDDFTRSWSSYAANYEALRGSPTLHGSFPDGTANTVAVLEHFARCAGRANFVDDMVGLCTNGLTREPLPIIRRATFADGPNRDVTSLTGPTLGKTFQVAPADRDCDWKIPQTPHSAGIVCAMADGSVRIISGSISPATFWAAVTPNGQDAIGSDW